MANQSSPGLTRRAVAGSFIFKFPADWPDVKTPQVALFRRSAKVRTYQHRLAPISGSVEKEDSSPLDTAWREICEETTLTPLSLELIRQGKPYSFVDPSINREWTLNPFAFRLKPPSEGGRGEAGIEIDWEHEGWEWFDPLRVVDSDEFGGVPRLTESLRRCWFQYDLGPDVGHTLAKGLDELKNDHESGARQLAAKALGTFIDVATQLPVESLDQWWKNVRMSAWHIWKNGRESMGAATLNVMLSSLALVQRSLLEAKSPLVPQFPDLIRQQLQEYGEQRLKSVDTLWESFERILADCLDQRTDAEPTREIRVLTLSSSSTIAVCLERAIRDFNSPFEIRILESRPLFEGVSLASRLTSHLQSQPGLNRKTRITIYTDAAAAVAATGVDVVLLGADLIDQDGAVSNKTGSLPTVLAARHICPSAKVIILAEKEKILPFAPPSHAEENDPSEVTSAWSTAPKINQAAVAIEPSQVSNSGGHADSPVRVEIKNVYFEWVSPSLIDAYAFEDRPRVAQDISALAQKSRDAFDEFFEGL